MRCPTDRNLLLRNDSDKPLYQCSDCSGVFVSPSTEGVEDATILDAPASRICCPRDGSRMHVNEVEGVAFHLCGKCRSAWLDGDAQEKLFSKMPGWFGKPRTATAATTAGAVAIEAIIAILGS